MTQAMSDGTPGRDELREALLLATLPHVAFDGWGQKALMAGMSPEIGPWLMNAGNVKQCTRATHGAVPGARSRNSKSGPR